MYKFLLFDIDGTLMDFEKDKTYAFNHMYAASGLQDIRPLNDELVEIYETCNMRWWHRFEKGLCTKPELFNNRFIDFFSEAGLPQLDPEWINKLYFDALGETGTLFPGAVELLETLQPHYDIYIVTNGNASSQMTRMERSGILRYIKDYFISETAGAAKPDKRYFDYVMARIPGSLPENCIVIGDSLSSDMLGAKNAEMDSIWYNPLHAENTLQVPVTHEVTDFDTILQLLLPNDHE